MSLRYADAELELRAKAAGEVGAQLLRAAASGDDAKCASLCRASGNTPTALLSEAQDREGCTALVVAAKHGHVNVLRVLINADAASATMHKQSLESVLLRCDQHGRSALHHAALRSHVDAIRQLVEAGSNVDAADIKGFTPLHLCSATAPARVLIEAGADVLTTDNAGHTPLQHMDAVLVTSAPLLSLLRQRQQRIQRGGVPKGIIEAIPWRWVLAAFAASMAVSVYTVSLLEVQVPLQIKHRV